MPIQPQRALSLPHLLALFTLLWTSSSQAYCRTHACDEKLQSCPRDVHGCVTVEKPIYWAGGEAELWVDQAGSPLWNLSAEEVLATLRVALGHWTSVICPDGKPPQLSITLPGILPSSEDDAEISVVRFLDEDSSYQQQVIAMTQVKYFPRSGEFSAADIEVNSEHHSFVLRPQLEEDIDLEAALTHELGHFLGLDHSDVPGATMQPEAMGLGGIDLRTLEPDDVAGLCAIYGEGNLPEPAAPESSPAHGGCSVAPGSDTHAATPWAVLVFGLLVLTRVLHGGRRCRSLDQHRTGL